MNRVRCLDNIIATSLLGGGALLLPVAPTLGVNAVATPFAVGLEQLDRLVTEEKEFVVTPDVNSATWYNSPNSFAMLYAEGTNRFGESVNLHDRPRLSSRKTSRNSILYGMLSDDHSGAYTVVARGNNIVGWNIISSEISN